MAERRKLVMLGMAGVGKTSIVNRIVDDTFDDNERTTIGGRLRGCNVTLARVYTVSGEEGSRTHPQVSPE